MLLLLLLSRDVVGSGRGQTTSVGKLALLPLPSSSSSFRVSFSSGASSSSDPSLAFSNVSRPHALRLAPPVVDPGSPPPLSATMSFDPFPPSYEFFFTTLEVCFPPLLCSPSAYD